MCLLAVCACHVAYACHSSRCRGLWLRYVIWLLCCRCLHRALQKGRSFVLKTHPVLLPSSAVLRCVHATIQACAMVPPPPCTTACLRTSSTSRSSGQRRHTTSCCSGRPSSVRAMTWATHATCTGAAFCCYLQHGPQHVCEGACVPSFNTAFGQRRSAQTSSFAGLGSTMSGLVCHFLKRRRRVCRGATHCVHPLPPILLSACTS